MKTKIISTLPKNDNNCGWIKQLPSRTSQPSLAREELADWVVLGAGYTGLATARQLSKLHPQARIILLEGQKAGEGSSARNSGFLVDSILNESHFSAAGLEEYRKKYEIKHAGVKAVQQMVAELGIDCDLEASGKFHCTATKSNEKKLLNFSKLLSELELKHKILEGEELRQRLGSSYYRMALWTAGGVMLQPAKLARGMLDKLPEQVELFENSPVLSWRKLSNSEGYQLSTPSGQVSCKKLIVTVNGFLASCGVKANRTFPLTLTAGLTRPLTAGEDEAIGRPDSWGVLSAQSMGATVRLTKDRRILMRNTVEVWPSINMSTADLQTRKENHIIGLKRRFPQLGGDLFESSWSGTICISGNNANVFTKVEDGVYAAGCYNASGIGMGVLFGTEIANLASGEMTEEIRMIQTNSKPMYLPPQPFLRWVVGLRILRDRLLARHEQ
ncbi:MAG: FAD-binding oxidoreductase [SAR324 cluster bacterium]|nr:FAD-binding oxidoreductase [SAR324 cluster bacterium]MBL7035480.1 FAD-binding oxidoreductase [SAR324 cluster bacterium]